MKKLIALAVVVMCLVVAGASFAEDYNSGHTSGITSISQVLVDNGGGTLEYNWFLTNNTGTSASPVYGLSVLIWGLQPFNVPNYLETPFVCLTDGTPVLGWKWNVNGNGWKSADVVNNQKYDAPPAPSIAPGETKKFVYRFLRKDLGTIGVNEAPHAPVIGFNADVAAVIWDAAAKKWEPAPGNSVSSSQTWFEHPTDSVNAVPEPMSMALALMGLSTLAGYAGLRRRKA